MTRHRNFDYNRPETGHRDHGQRSDMLRYFRSAQMFLSVNYALCFEFACRVIFIFRSLWANTTLNFKSISFLLKFIYNFDCLLQ